VTVRIQREDFDLVAGIARLSHGRVSHARDRVLSRGDRRRLT
jgi:hypothetical protein